MIFFAYRRPRRVRVLVPRPPATVTSAIFSVTISYTLAVIIPPAIYRFLIRRRAPVILLTWRTICIVILRPSSLLIIRRYRALLSHGPFSASLPGIWVSMAVTRLVPSVFVLASRRRKV